MRVCDICKGGKDTELYVVHTAIYVNKYPHQVDDLPNQINPNEAEICERCYKRLVSAMRDVKTILDNADSAERYSNSLWEKK